MNYAKEVYWQPKLGGHDWVQALLHDRQLRSSFLFCSTDSRTLIGELTRMRCDYGQASRDGAQMSARGVHGFCKRTQRYGGYRVWEVSEYRVQGEGSTRHLLPSGV